MVRKIKYVFVVWFLMAVILLLWLFFNDGIYEDKESNEIQDKSLSTEEVFYESTEIEEFFIGEDLYITNTGSYSGPFVEDGSDVPVENVYCIIIENRNIKDLQYTELTLKIENKTYKFALSTIPSGASVLVLEQNKKAYEKGNIESAYADNTVFFDKRCSLEEEQFIITTSDQIINIQNRNETVFSDVYVYYKNQSENYYIGGITYRAKADGLAEKEIKQIHTKHYSKKNSKVLFVTYEG